MGNIKRNTYIKYIGIMIAVWAVVMSVFIAIYLQNIKDKEEAVFIKDVNEMLPAVEDFALTFSNESFKKAFDVEYEHNVTFSIRNDKGDPIWLNDTIYFVGDNEEGNGFVSGLTNDEYISIKEKTVTPFEIDKVYSYRISVTDAVKNNDILVLPGKIEISSYVSEDNYDDIYDVLAEYDSIEYDELPDKMLYEISAPDTSSTYTGTIKNFFFFKDDFRLMNTSGFSDDLNRFESCTQLYRSGNGDLSCQYEKPLGFMKGIYICARPINVNYNGTENSAWVVFAKTADFWDLYGKIMVLFGGLSFLICAAIGMIIAKKKCKLIYINKE
ncbi:MAG: hypothetical protein IJC41_02630 [Firmicutes bacterium]|nr:hypothetical protein [Bacillota bacterium]